jgi:hypothetical protein
MIPVEKSIDFSRKERKAILLCALLLSHFKSKVGWEMYKKRRKVLLLFVSTECKDSCLKGYKFMETNGLTE